MTQMRLGVRVTVAVLVAFIVAQLLAVSPQTPPREYLRGKDWAIRTQIGMDALILHGVLKP